MLQYELLQLNCFKKFMCSIPCIKANFPFMHENQKMYLQLHTFFIINTYTFRSRSVTILRVYNIVSGIGPQYKAVHNEIFQALVYCKKCYKISNVLVQS